MQRGQTELNQTKPVELNEQVTLYFAASGNDVPDSVHAIISNPVTKTNSPVVKTKHPLHCGEFNLIAYST